MYPQKCFPTLDNPVVRRLCGVFGGVRKWHRELMPQVYGGFPGCHALRPVAWSSAGSNRGDSPHHFPGETCIIPRKPTPDSYMSECVSSGHSAFAVGNPLLSYVIISFAPVPIAFSTI